MNINTTCQRCGRHTGKSGWRIGAQQSNQFFGKEYILCTDCVRDFQDAMDKFLAERITI